MGSITYLNIYIYGVLAFIGATVFGCFFFYEGMGATSFVVSTAAGQVTYYIDNNQYNLYFQGFVYCLTFAIAGFLLLTVMAIPSADILGRQRTVAAPGFAAPQMVAPQAPPQQTAPHAPPQQAAPQAPPKQAAPQAPPKQAAPQAQKPSPSQPLEPAIDEIEEEFEELESDDRAEEAGDSDVVFGTGRVTEESTVNFIHRNPDSAIKFLYRKTLDGKPLPASEDEIYQTWQRRGLSRNRVRDYILQMMEWEALPTDKTLMDIWSELRDQIFELTH